MASFRVRVSFDYAKSALSVVLCIWRIQSIYMKAHATHMFLFLVFG